MVRADGSNRVHLGLVAVAALLVLAALACGGGGEEGLQLVFYSDRDGDDDIYWNDDGLPIGAHFVGRFGDEATLFRLAAQLEQARPWADRRPPVSATAVSA